MNNLNDKTFSDIFSFLIVCLPSIIYKDEGDNKDWVALIKGSVDYKIDNIKSLIEF